MVYVPPVGLFAFGRGVVQLPLPSGLSNLISICPAFSKFEIRMLPSVLPQVISVVVAAKEVQSGGQETL